jgi:hypothetical protein
VLLWRGVAIIAWTAVLTISAWLALIVDDNIG